MDRCGECPKSVQNAAQQPVQASDVYERRIPDREP